MGLTENIFGKPKAAGDNLLFHRLRWVLGMWMAADIALYWDEPESARTMGVGLLVFFVVSQIVLYKLPARLLAGLRIYTVVFLMDLFLGLGTLFAMGQVGNGLLLAVFLGIFISALIQRLDMAALVAVVSSSIYLSVLYHEMGEKIFDDYRLFLDLPFILMIALHAAITVNEAKFHEEISEALDSDNKALSKKLGTTASELKRRSSFMATAYDGIPAATVVLDSEGMVRGFNAQAEELFQAKRSRALDKPIREVPFLQPLRRFLVDNRGKEPTGVWLATGKYTRIYTVVRNSLTRDAENRLINLTAFIQPAEAPATEAAPPPLKPEEVETAKQAAEAV